VTQSCPPSAAGLDRGAAPRRWDTFFKAPESRRKTFVPSNLEQVHRGPLPGGRAIRPRFPTVLDTASISFGFAPSLADARAHARRRVLFDTVISGAGFRQAKRVHDNGLIDASVCVVRPANSAVQ